MAHGPFGPWEVDGEPREAQADDLPDPLEEFRPIYKNMGALGWEPPLVDLLELWQVADFVGTGGDPVIRGSRGLVLPKDEKGSSGWKPTDTSLAARIHKAKALAAQQTLDLEETDP